jgi:transposase-like protein
MTNEDFDALAQQIEKLTPYQRRLLSQRLGDIQNKQAVNTLIESRVLSAPGCPACAHTEVARWGSASGLQRYRCKACKTTFNALTGTPLARLRLKDKWLDCAQQLEQGQSVRKSAQALGVHRNTAFRWRHRFLAGPSDDKPASLVGIAEADEAFFLESFKGKKQAMPRKARKRGGKASKRGLSAEQIPVLICRDRSGSTTDFILPKDDKKHLLDALGPILAKDAILCTDGSQAMLGAARQMDITHRAVNLAAGIRVIEKVYHVQNVNAYGSRLKTWMRRFNGVATCHLANYLGWRRYLDRTHSRASPSAFLRLSLGIKNLPQQLTMT